MQRQSPASPRQRRNAQRSNHGVNPFSIHAILFSNSRARAREGSARGGESDSVVVFVTVTVPSDKDEEFNKVMAADVAGSRAEPGCLRFDLVKGEKTEKGTGGDRRGTGCRGGRRPPDVTDPFPDATGAPFHSCGTSRCTSLRSRTSWQNAM